MALIKLMFGLLLFAVSIGAFVSIITFLVDVIKWHDKEKPVKIKPSNEPLPHKDYTESEVSNVGDDAGQYNTSAFLGSGLQS